MKLSYQQKKWIIISLSTVVVLFVVAYALAMSKRDAYLKAAVVKVQHKLKQDYKVDFLVGKYKFDGLSTVVFDQVLLKPEHRDTLATMDRLGVRVRLWPLIFGDIKIDDLNLINGKVSFVKKDTVSNYDFLFRKRNKDSVKLEEPNTRNFAEWAEKMAKQVFSKVPNSMLMRNFELSYKDSVLYQRIRVPEAIIDDGDFETRLFLNDHDAEWKLKGYVNGDKQRLKVEVSSKEKGVELPFIKGKYGLAVSFDKLIFDLTGIKRVKKDVLHIDGSFAYENLLVKHRRLSDSAILLPEAQGTGGLEIASNYIALTDDAKIKVKNFSLAPRVKFIMKPSKRLELAVHTGKFKAQDFFDAIPNGLFETLDGIQVEGDVAYNLDFAVDFDKPDNIIFNSTVDDKDLKIVRWGKADIASLNRPFTYDAYNDTVLVRQILVGTANPNFVPLTAIPYVLKTTVRNTEDPFFYQHKGFEKEAFKLSIATNIKEKKFKRGASTISMQLVKNVFLNRKKTMTRKFEEILLVWLMESSHQVSKDRLLEIYLNVIEWGTNVYGIAEASNYYFQKKPQDINLGESLFLSSIIPRPKTGLSSFDYTGHLKPWVQRHFNTYGSIMTKVGDLRNVDVPAGYGFYEVLLQAKLRPATPVFRDTSDLDIINEHEAFMREMDQDEEVKRSILEKIFGKEQQ
ncbi:transglycosylase domain-containing protein [Sphingobacterium sp. Mn56C]|uniref:transglycosylase domain-containing protein n=1 Tax=Sphingobacterium sp. Mn56C TaxID=3395261 RepID=UPI003BE8FC68